MWSMMNTMKPVVLSMGGSVLLSKTTTKEYLEKLADLLTRVSKKNPLYIIIGGGRIAREYIHLGRTLGFHEHDLDELGIAVTRMNALFFLKTLRIQQSQIPGTISEAAKIKQPLIVMGGTTPGHSTDMVGAELAAAVKAERFVIATNVDGVFDKDPNVFDDAVLLHEVSINDLITQYGTKWDAAGKNTVIDGPALQCIQQEKIPTFVVNGTQLDQMKQVLLGEQFRGTKIRL